MHFIPYSFPFFSILYYYFLFFFILSYSFYYNLELWRAGGGLDLQGFLAILAVQDDWESLVDLADGAFLAFPDYLEGWKE